MWITTVVLGLCLGCWAEWPLDDHVRHRSLIVVGTISEIARAPVPAPIANPDVIMPRVYDLATIRITEVVKTSDPTITAAGTLILAMPAAPHRMSTDFAFPAGTTGIWMLTFYDGAWRAARPDDLQEMAHLEQIRALAQPAK